MTKTLPRERKGNCELIVGHNSRIGIFWAVRRDGQDKAEAHGKASSITAAVIDGRCMLAMLGQFDSPVM